MLVPVLISLGFLAFADSTSFWAEPATREGDALFALAIAFCEWISLTAVMGFAAFQLDAAGKRTSSSKRNVQSWMPAASTALFAAIVFFVRFGCWVPVEIGALFALPCVIIPPLTYRVTHHKKAKNAPPVFSLEETCLALDAAKASSLIGQFLERYPNVKAYVYRNPQSHSAGGLLMHNIDRLAVPDTTYMEVTLHCPFTTRMGVFSEGRETFRAYLRRVKPNGCILKFLPHKTWDEWLAGLTRKEWFEYIQELDGRPPTHPPTNNLPYQFLENKWTWEAIQLT